MRELSLFSGTTKLKLPFSKDLDYCQKALDKMDDIDRSSTSRKTSWLLQKKQCDLKFALLIIILVRPSCNMDKIWRRHWTLARRIPHIYITLSYSNC